MVKFVARTGLYFLLLVGVVLFYLSFADGYTDPFYMRFTTPKQTNLILGSSRAAQGIQPKVLEKKIKKNFFNYSFTVSHSPYGSVYLESIKKKLDTSKSNQIFILSVDPWTLSTVSKDPNDFSTFEENNLILGKTQFVNSSPNYEYLLENLSGKYDAVFNRCRIEENQPYTFLHSDGWLEVNFPYESEKVEKNIQKKVEFYRNEMLPRFKFSPYRKKQLIETINYLSFFGDVYLVRMPIHPKIQKIDDELLPDFDNLIIELKAHYAAYFDLTDWNTKCKYTDGNHLYKTSGAQVSARLALMIAKNRLENRRSKKDI